MAAILKKDVKCDISAIVLPILVKFGMVMHNCPPNDRVYQKFANLKMQDGGQLSFLKSKNRNISRTVLPIMMGVCMMTHIVHFAYMKQ